MQMCNTAEESTKVRKRLSVMLKSGTGLQLWRNK
jgi:hypothetical protein